MNWYLLSLLGKMNPLNIKLFILEFFILRLSKLCIDELETQLEESKSSLTTVLIEKENMKTEVRKLEAKVCFMDKPLDIQTTTKKESVKASSSILAPPKLSSVKEAVKEDAKEASKNTRRRSTRSASSLANYMIAESLSTAEENTNKKRARVETAEDNNTKAKVKKTGLPTPVKKTGAGSGDLAVVEEREPLGCVTNSPVKTQQKRTTRASRGGQKRNPEECKQQ